MNEKNVYRVGSRKSELALIQTNYVIQQLKEKYPDKKFEIVQMSTTGDRILDKPLPKIGEKSLFTKELEDALLKNEVDFVVHSLKDLPTELPNKLTVGAVLQREDPCDVLILNKNSKGKTLKSLPQASIIGTSSLRRHAQLARNYPNVIVKDIRGNLNTRLRKVDQQDDYTGMILAYAGVKRMGWENRIVEKLEPSEFMYAVGQGALAVECCSDFTDVLEMLQVLNHVPTILQVLCERSFLKTLGGGCSAPVAVCSSLEEQNLSLTGGVWSLDGVNFLVKSKKIKLGSEEPMRKISRQEPKSHVSITAFNVSSEDLNAADDLGIYLAKELISEGALDIISRAKSENEKTAEPLSKNKTANGEVKKKAVNVVR